LNVRELPAVPAPEPEPGPERPARKPASGDLLCPELEQRDEMSGPPERIDKGGSASEGQRCDDRPSDLGDDMPPGGRRALLERGETDERVIVLRPPEPEHHRLAGSGELPLSPEMLVPELPVEVPLLLLHHRLVEEV
jgi:hypothetical protein